jgi:hypothetical protein
MLTFKRRELLKKVTGGSVIALLAAGGATMTMSESSLAADGTLTASDITVQSTDGQLLNLTIAPEITVEWSNQDSSVASVEVTWHAAAGGVSKGTVGNTPATFQTDSATTDGTFTTTMEKIDLLQTLDSSDFSAPNAGETTVTTVELWMDVLLRDSGDNIVDEQDGILTTSFDVTVDHTESGGSSASLSASATAHTSGS